MSGAVEARLGAASGVPVEIASENHAHVAVGGQSVVKFGVTTASGGADAIMAVITVNQNLGPSGAHLAQGAVSAVTDGGGLIRFALQGVAPKAAELLVFDLAGRMLTRLEGHSEEPLRWDGRDAHGMKVASGVYFYRVWTESATYWGRLVRLR